MAGILGGCLAIEPIVEVSEIIKLQETIQESPPNISTEGDANPQDSMTESATVQVT